MKETNMPGFRLVLVGIFWLNAVCCVRADDFEVRLRFPARAGSDDMECNVYIVREGSILSHASTAQDGSYVLEKPSEKQSFDLIVAPRNNPLIVVENILGVDRSIELKVAELARRLAFGDVTRELNIERVRAQWLDIQKARSLLTDDDFERHLKRLEAMLLGQETLSLLIPAYFYPANGGQDGEWKRLITFCRQLRAASDAAKCRSIFT